MRLNKTTEYAVRTLVFLELHPGIQKLESIAKEMYIPEGYLVKVLRTLRMNKMVSSVQGVNGGYQLGCPPEELSIYDVMTTTERSMKISSCLEPDNCISGEERRMEVTYKKMNKVYYELQDLFEDKVKGVTIKDLVEEMKEGGNNS